MSTETKTTEDQFLNLDRFAKPVKEIIGNAQTLADKMKHKEVLPIHLFAATLNNASVIKTMQDMKISETDAKTAAEKAVSEIEPSKKEEAEGLSVAAMRILEKLEKAAGKSVVELEMFFKALIASKDKQSYLIFHAFNVGLDDFCAELQKNRANGFADMDPARLLRMEEFIGKRVIGQKEAIHAVSRTVRRGKVGLNDGNRPIGSMLFLGPSGVGKTELAKALSEFLYESERNLIRFDMSEFGSSHTVQRLIGSPPGYVGSQEGGQLTEAVKKNPNAVLLFDEIEKGHADVYNVFLQILDDGRLSDGLGRLVDFSNTIILMTSNIGSRKIVDMADELLQDNEESKDSLYEMLRHELLAFMRPELLNRIDETIYFTPLSKLEIADIVAIQLRKLEKALDKKGMKLNVNQEARDAMVLLGYSPLFGARPTKRLVQRSFIDPTCERILDGTYKAGSTVNIGFRNDQFVFLDDSLKTDTQLAMAQN